MSVSKCGNRDPVDVDPGFLEDPSLFRDELPQPYRRINKILYEEIFEEAWQQISQRESDRIREASRIRPPIYDCATPLLLGDSKVRCLAVSPDSLYVCVGLSDGLAILSALTQDVEAIWKDGGLEIVEAEVKALSNNTILINCKDMQGFVRFFAYTSQLLIPLHDFNELDVSAERIVIKSAISSAVDFVGICILDKTSPQLPLHWLEVYKLPKDAWLTEIEAAAVAIQIEEKQRANRTEFTDGDELSGQVSGINSIVQGSNSQLMGSHSFLLPRPHSSVSQRIISTQKFSIPLMSFKLQYPNKPSAMTWSSVYQASKAAGMDGDVIGVGMNHLISTVHMNNRNAAFRNQHKQYSHCLPKDIELPALNPLPSFHFLLPRKSSSQDVAYITNAIAVWWSGDRHLMQYSLGKQTKVVNKSEFVWSLSSPVVCSAVSSCNCLVALALANNSVVIWDRFLGLPRKTVHMNDCGQISWIHFVSPLSPEKCTGTEPAATLLVLLTSGFIYTVICTSHSDPVATLVSNETLCDCEIPSNIQLIRGIPALILVTRKDGRIFLHDIYLKKALCEVALPDCNDFDGSECFSIATVPAALGKMLYVLRTIVRTEYGGEDMNVYCCADPSLFTVKMCLFPHLDSYLKETRLLPQPQILCSRVSQNRIEEHIVKTMQKRVKDQPNRKDRLQKRWLKMKEELSEKLNVKVEKPMRA